MKFSISYNRIFRIAKGLGASAITHLNWVNMNHFWNYLSLIQPRKLSGILIPPYAHILFVHVLFEGSEST